MRKFIFALFLVPMVLYSVCTTVSCTQKEDQKVEVTNIVLNQTSLSLEPGASFTLTATVEPGNATDKTVSWSSSNSSVASVSGGIVNALGKGTAIITASAGNKTASCTVTVTPKTIAVNGVSINKTELSLYVGDTFTLEATVSPDNATDKTAIWSSTDSGVASVSNGLVTAVSQGSATITATAGGKSASCIVTVSQKSIDVNEVSLNKTKLSLYVGDTFTLEATVSPDNATDKTVTWSSSDSGVASVSNGLVTAVSQGSATITATAGGKSASCTVTVFQKKIDVSEVSISVTELFLYIGDTFTLEATVSPDNATDKTVTWSSTDSGIASVSNGLVTAVSEGLAIVTATAGGKSASCTVVVQRRVVEVASIELDSYSLTIPIGKTVHLGFKYYPENADNVFFSWSVANTDVAVVDNSGNITGIAPGETTVKVMALNGISATACIFVTLSGGNEEYGYEDLN